VQVTTERQENCIVKLTVSVDERRTNELLRRSARTLSRRYRLPGFRPGKAPYNVVVRHLGIESIQSQVLDQFGDEVFEEGLEQSGLQPIDQASLEDVTWDPSFTLHLAVPVGPEIDLGDYREIRIPWQGAQVTDEKLDEALVRLQREQSEWQSADRPAEIGDQIVADITAKVKDEVVLDNTDREMILNDGSPYPVPGFAAAIVGMQAGETREFNQSYPEDHYNADIAGQEGHFTVTLKQIRAQILPPLDDEFAIMVGDYESLDDLKAKVRQSLQQKTENRLEQAFEERMWDELLQVVSIEYPEVYVDREVDVYQQQLARQLQPQGIDLASFFQISNMTEEAWREQVRPQAAERLKRNLVLRELIKIEELAVEDGEVDAEIAKMLESLGDRADDMREMIESDAGRMSITDGLLTQKALDHLKAIVRAPEAAEETGTGEPEGEEAAEATEAGIAEADAPQASEVVVEAPDVEDAPETGVVEADAQKASEDAQAAASDNIESENGATSGAEAEQVAEETTKAQEQAEAEQDEPAEPADASDASEDGLD
jgi:trigger factor